MTAQMRNGQMVWTASASNDGVIEHDTGSVAAHTPLDALLLLANELYEEVSRLSEAYEFEHPSTSDIVANLAARPLKCDSLGGHNYGRDGVCIRQGCGRYDERDL